MSERAGRRNDDPLERELAELGARLVFPPTPDLAGDIADRLRADVPDRRSPAPLVRVWPWRLAAAAAVLALLVAGIVASVPSAGLAVAERLGLPGVVIRFLDGAPTAVPPDVGTELMLGRRVTLEEAQAAVPYEIRVPSGGTIGGTGEVYLSGVPRDRMVSVVYPPGAGLSASAPTGVGALLTQFRGSTDRGLIDKGLAVTKGIDAGTSVEAVDVAGETGYWIEGEPHLFLYRDWTGDVQSEEFRLAGNVLLWTSDGVTFRLESALSKEESLAVAESVRPVG